MNYQELRQKYPKFVYEKYEYEFVGNNLEIKFFYSIPPDHHFTHKLVLNKISPTNLYPQLDTLIFNIGLSLIPSYWKSTCSPLIELPAMNSELTTNQLAYWNKLFIKGMGEYYYKNQIDFTKENFVILKSQTTRAAGRRQSPGSEHVVVETLNSQNNKVLVPVGGGKDSIVTIELLKSKYKVVPFVVNPVPLITNVIQEADIEPPIFIESIIDPHLLELNKLGYLNGHVPVTAYHSFLALLSAYLLNINYIAFSNERSSNEGNTTYLNQQINHQYSKSLEFETDFNEYLKASDQRLAAINYFSFLRPLYELQITKIFSRYPKYFPIFSSCNQNFKQKTSDQRPSTLWCQHCPKCVSTSLMLSCFIPKQKIIEFMGTYPPDLLQNKEILDQLLGNSPIKPFECVLTRDEAQAAYNQKGLDKILNSWMDNPNMPQEFTNILKTNYGTN